MKNRRHTKSLYTFLFVLAVLVICLGGCQHRSLETKDMTDRQAHLKFDASDSMQADHVKIDSSAYPT